MRFRKLLIGLVLVTLVGLAGWFGLRWYTTPVPPEIPLDGVHKEVAEVIEQAVQEVHRQPRSGKTWGKLSQLLLAHGFNEQAIPCLVQAQRFDPNQPCWPYLQGSVSLLLSRPREGIPSLRKALALCPVSEERGAILFLLAQALVEDGQLDETEQHLQALREFEGDSPRVHFGLGLLALARDNRSRAREHLKTLTDHPCARKQVNSLLATLTPGDRELAENYRTRAVRLPPDLPWPCSFDAEVRQHRVEPVEPLDRYNQLLAAGRRTEAVDFLRQVVAQAPNEQASMVLGFVLIRMNEFEEAEQVLRDVLAINKRHLKAHLLLGAALLERGNRLSQKPGSKDQALELFRQAVRAEDGALDLQSDLAPAHLIRGRALKSLGRTKEALAALRQAVLIGPDLAEAHQTLGETLAETGQVREGLEHLENAVRVAPPQDPRPRQALEKWRAKAKPSS